MAAVGYYYGFIVAFAVLAVATLNRGHGSARVYPSVAAACTFVLFMAVLGQEMGYAFNTAWSSSAASVIVAAVAYAVATLLHKIWSHGLPGKIATVAVCIVFFYFSVPTLAIGKTLLIIFAKPFARGDEICAQERQKPRRRRAYTVKTKRRLERQDALLSRLSTQEELLSFMDEVYQTIGCETELRLDETPTLSVHKDGKMFRFVVRQSEALLTAADVDWAASLCGDADTAVLVTTGAFSGAAVKQAKQLGVSLVDGANLPRFERMARRERAALLTGQEAPEEESPEEGSDLPKN